MNKNEAMFNEDYKKGLLSKSALEHLLNNSDEEQELIINNNINKNDKQKISIIIPTHNRLKELKKLLNSIFAQTYTNYEIIIIDDVSTDDTERFFTELYCPKIKYVRNNKNLGMGLNRQKGYKIATGEFVIYSDDDDYYVDNDYFKDAIKILKDKDISSVCSSSYIHYENDDIYEPHSMSFDKKIKSIEYLKRFQFDWLKPTSTFPLIVRKSILEKANFKDMKMMNDSSIYLRHLMVSNYVYANRKNIGIYRVHNSNDTLNVKADFTIKNLQEKKYIYKYLKKQNVNFDLKDWFEKEIKITACHFFNGREKSKWKRRQVLYYVLFNVSYRLFKELYKLEKDRKHI